MDYNNGLFSAGVTATIIAVGGILYKVFSTCNHHRIVSRCCGRKLDVSLDIQETTPPPPKIESPPQIAIVENPPK